jgi:hypothetical protein
VLSPSAVPDVLKLDVVDNLTVDINFRCVVHGGMKGTIKPRP